MSYILNNIPFFIILGITALTSLFIFFTPYVKSEHKKLLIDEFVFCFVLCLLTFCADLIFVPEPILERLRYIIMQLTRSWGFFVSITSYVYAFLAVAGLFTALRAIPVIGKGLQWLAWILLTIPERMFFLVMKTPATAQNIFDLFNVKADTAAATIFNYLSPCMIFIAVIPNVIVITAVYILFRKRKANQAQAFRTGRFFAGILMFTAYCIYPKGITEDSIGHSTKVILSAAESLKYRFIQREPFVNKTFQAKPNDNILIIIDEAIRADYLSINNSGINTTPVFAKYFHDYPGNMFNYGIEVAAATSSSTGRSSILSGWTEIPDRNLTAFKKPTLFNIAKANGYKTILMNVQSDFPDALFRESDMKDADEIYQSGSVLEAMQEMDGDFKAAEFIRRRFTEEKGLFMVLEKMGAHVPYEDRYPGDDPANQIFMPKMDKGEWYTLEKRRKVINSYKNNIRYNIDGFFSRLFGNDPLSLTDCTVIYTSDHGQSLMEYGQLESHTTHYLEQTLVPLVVFTTDSWVLENIKRPEEIRCTLSGMNIYPTVISILCRDKNQVSGAYQSLITEGEISAAPLIWLARGPLWDGRVSAPASTDINGKIILPEEKYMY